MTAMQTVEMTAALPSETTSVHTRLLKCALCVDESRAYWSHRKVDTDRPSPLVAFEAAWFGAKSLSWIDVIINNLRARFDAFPEALWVLARWTAMTPETRRLICHFHLQLTDPLYRRFTAEYLPSRQSALHAQVQHHSVVRWVADQGPGRWTAGTQKQFATRLLSCALAARLVKGRRDPREVLVPHVPDDALLYLMYLLRGLRFQGSMHANPYLASVGLQNAQLADRLRNVPAVRYYRAADLHEFEWQYPNLKEWARHAVLAGGG
jgi:hypothetical protein